MLHHPKQVRFGHECDECDIASRVVTDARQWSKESNPHHHKSSGMVASGYGILWAWWCFNTPRTRICHTLHPLRPANTTTRMSRRRESVQDVGVALTLANGRSHPHDEESEESRNNRRVFGSCVVSRACGGHSRRRWMACCRQPCC